MIIQNNLFDNLEMFIEHLKKNDNVVGIVEYGGRTYTNMSVGGDYDLTVIFNQPISKNFSGVHFHINDIPVDCMLLSKEDFMSDTPITDFLLVHLNCKILYDKDDITAKLLDRIKTTWNKPTTLSDFELNLFRFSFQHVLDKLRYRLHDDELYTKYFIFSSVDWFLSCFARIKGWEIGKPKLHLKLIQEQESQLYGILLNLYSENSLDIQFELLTQCANYMIDSVGGLWKDNEVLFHLVPNGVNDVEEQKSVFKKLLNQ